MPINAWISGFIMPASPRHARSVQPLSSKIGTRPHFSTESFKNFLEEDNIRTPEYFHKVTIGNIKDSYRFSKTTHAFGSDHVGAFSKWFGDKLTAKGIKNNVCPASVIKGRVL